MGDTRLEVRTEEDVGGLQVAMDDAQLVEVH